MAPKGPPTPASPGRSWNGRPSALGSPGTDPYPDAYLAIPLKNAHTASVFFMKLLLLPTKAIPSPPPPVPQSELPNQQWPPPMIEQPVTFTLGHDGQPEKLTHVVSPPLGTTVAGVVVDEHPSPACIRPSEGACVE